MSLTVVTGGNGFVGANLCRALRERGERFVVLEPRPSGPVHPLLQGMEVEMVPLASTGSFLARNEDRITSILHLGAISDTRCRDAALLKAMNVDATLRLWRWARARDCRFVYASSAATYGDGSAGFADRSDPTYLQTLAPLNDYARSKHLADRRIWSSQGGPGATAGLKFFNVYGPGESHKGPQASMALQAFEQLERRGAVELFAFDEGPPRRDFIWVGDCVDAILWLRDRPEVTGLFNLGSGTSRSFEDVVACVARALGRPAAIEAIAVPDALAAVYQRLTLCDNAKIDAAGFARARTSLEHGAASYCRWLRDTLRHAA